MAVTLAHSQPHFWGQGNFWGRVGDKEQILGMGHLLTLLSYPYHKMIAAKMAFVRFLEETIWDKAHIWTLLTPSPLQATGYMPAVTGNSTTIHNIFISTDKFIGAQAI